MNKHTLVLTALLVSLSANLLIAGFVIGRKQHRPPEAPPMAWAAERLSAETQAKVRRQMRAQVSEVRPLREAMRNAQAAVREAVTTDAYDPNALTLALKESRDVSSRYQALIHKNLVALSKELPKQERMALARAALQRGQSKKMPSRPSEKHR